MEYEEFMVEFHQGTPDSVIERLCKTVSNFDRLWLEKCVPASEEQIQQLENICSQYSYRVPKVYLDYLKIMGEDDGGLLEREWDGYMEPSLHTILELFCEDDFDAEDDLQRGLLLFSYHWTDANCYLRVSSAEDNPVVTDRENHYFAGSFEKYLFQKAFDIYQEKFEYKSSFGTSVNSCDAILKKHSFPCSICGGTAEEKMQFVRWLVKSLELHEEEMWFGDDLHYFSYDEHYALKANLYSSLLLVFSCDDMVLKEKTDSQLTCIFENV